jgi:hypothetical protein
MVCVRVRVRVCVQGGDERCNAILTAAATAFLAAWVSRITLAVSIASSAAAAFAINEAEFCSRSGRPEVWEGHTEGKRN